MRKITHALVAGAILLWPMEAAGIQIPGVGRIVALEGEPYLELGPAPGLAPEGVGVERLVARVNLPVAAGAWIRTPANSKIKVLLTDDSVFSIGEETDFGLVDVRSLPGGARRPTVFMLLRGIVRIQIGSPYRPDRPLRIGTPGADVIVTGSHLIVNVAEGIPQPHEPTLVAGTEVVQLSGTSFVVPGQGPGPFLLDPEERLVVMKEAIVGPHPVELERRLTLERSTRVARAPSGSQLDLRDAVLRQWGPILPVIPHIDPPEPPAPPQPPQPPAPPGPYPVPGTDVAGEWGGGPQTGPPRPPGGGGPPPVEPEQPIPAPDPKPGNGPPPGVGFGNGRGQPDGGLPPGLVGKPGIRDHDLTPPPPGHGGIPPGGNAAGRKRGSAGK